MDGRFLISSPVSLTSAPQGLLPTEVLLLSLFQVLIHIPNCKLHERNRGCGVSILADIQKPSRHSSRQPSLGDHV